MSAIDVRLDDVWKQYRLGARRKADAFWALRDVTLQVPRGASLGVIGRNGAGKSTLFKLLAGITAPTRGRIVIDGRLAALIEVGSGFHPELTGRENVFLSGAILGMRRREIADKLDRIVAFAGVERFIDTPVKWYSSGMYVRLGFAIAAHLEPDVLLVDEVLAVGDAEFQVKCLERIDELKNRGTTCLFISHDLSAVERLCDRAILLEGGTIVENGPPAEVVARYHRRLTFPGATPDEGAAAITTGVALTNLTVYDPAQPRSLSLGTGQAVHVGIRYVATRPLPNVEFELRYYSADGTTCVAAPRTGERGERLELRPPGGSVEFVCDALPLKPGAYYLGAIVRDVVTAKVLAWWDGETRVYVESGPAVTGQLYIPHRWRHVPGEALSAAPSASGEPPA
jgi:ABC-type polysaccharide/polyol phosphate transport system ATPase subunit